MQSLGSGPLVRMQGIVKRFGAVEALKGVDLDLLQGEVLGLVGDNAAGKSTLMKVLTGVHQPDGGRIFFEESPVHFRDPHDSRALGIEMIYQDLALVPSLDVVANVFLGREKVQRLLGGLIRRLDERAMEAAAWDVIRRLKINMDSVRKPVSLFSGGQQQAVAIGRAMSFNARVIIMDEPTANLAVREVGKVLDLVRELRSRAVSVILISHRLQDIFAVADRVMVLFGGRGAGVRRVADTTMDEVVRLIVGANGGSSNDK
jgi:ABC-type sugar transport system ATPase subunit